MARLTQIGMITMAFGNDRFIRQATTLARSLRRFMPQHRIALVTDRDDAGPLFDYTIPIDPTRVFGTFLKTDLYRYSPFEETFFIDSDCVVSRNFSDQLAAIRKYDFSPVVNRFLTRGDTDLWIRDVGQAIDLLGGTSFPKFNGGVYFYRKSDFAEQVFARAKSIGHRSKELGIVDFDDSGPGEETVIGLALSEMRVSNFYNDAGRLMRTPLNSSGPIHLDVLSGECHFVKEGYLVEPAICHFCGEWIDHPAYLIAERELQTGRPVPAALAFGTHLAYRRRLLAAKFRRKLASLATVQFNQADGKSSLL